MSAREYGRLRAHLRSIGQPTGPNDHWIAAHALARDVPLITHNLAEFQRVPGLTVETWMTGGGLRTWPTPRRRLCLGVKRFLSQASLLTCQSFEPGLIGGASRRRW